MRYLTVQNLAEILWELGIPGRLNRKENVSGVYLDDLLLTDGVDPLRDTLEYAASYKLFYGTRESLVVWG